MQLYKLEILLFAVIIVIVSYNCDCGKEITKGACAVSASRECHTPYSVA